MDLYANLEKVARLARTGRWSRLLHQPLRYAGAMLFLKYQYPRSGKGRLVNATTFFGADMQLLLPAATDIYLTGGKTHDSELRLAAWMLNRLQPGDCFVDVGAHFGYFSLLAAVVTGPSGQVYAFEAASGTSRILLRNAQPYPSVVVTHAAVSDEAGTVTFFEYPVLYSEYNTLNREQYAGTSWAAQHPAAEVEVTALTLDAFAAEHGVIPSVIKIDVEGAEEKVIKGAMALLRQHAPDVVLEYLADDKGNRAHREAARLLIEEGYRPHAIGKDGALIVFDQVQECLAHTGLESDNIVFRKTTTSKSIPTGS